MAAMPRVLIRIDLNAEKGSLMPVYGRIISHGDGPLLSTTTWCMHAETGSTAATANQRSQLQSECRHQWRDKPPRLSTVSTGADIKISSSGADDDESND